LDEWKKNNPYYYIMNPMETTEEHKNLKPKETFTIMKWVCMLLYQLELKLTVTIAITSVITGLRGIVTTYIITRVMDLLVNSVKNPNAELTDILPYLGILLGFNMLMSVLGYIDFTSSREFSTKIGYKTDIVLAEQLMKLGISTLEQPDVNNKIFRARSSIGNLENYYKQGIRILVYLVGFLISLGITIYYIPIMAPIVILTSLPEYLVNELPPAYAGGFLAQFKLRLP
jgi:ABC-type bacteriocin/lantibiotic exporter with double-glycine peptidase domain